MIGTPRHPAAVRRVDCVSLGATLIVLLAADSAWANGGLSMLYISKMYHWLLTIPLGIGEGLLLGLLLRRKLLRTIGIMTLANVGSLVAGKVCLFAFGGAFRGYLTSLDQPLYAVGPWLVRFWIAAFVLTLIVEWPFCLWALHGVKHRIAKSVAATLVLHVGSYAAITPLYYNNQVVGLYTNLTVDPSLADTVAEEGTIYFISTEDNHIWCMKLNGEEAQKVYELSESRYWNRLFVRRLDVGGPWSLWVSDRSNDQGFRPLNPDIGTIVAPWGSAHFEERMRGDWEAPWIDWGWAADLQPEAEREWEVYVWKFEDQGLRVRNVLTGESYMTGMHTPFLWWESRNATILPGGKVVYELRRQIVLLDLATRKVGFIRKGRSPVVVMSEAHVDG